MFINYKLKHVYIIINGKRIRHIFCNIQGQNVIKLTIIKTQLKLFEIGLYNDDLFAIHRFVSLS